MIAGAADPLRAPLDVSVEALRVGEIAAAREYHLRRLGRDLSSRFGRSGLDYDRPTLDRAGDVEGTAHRQEFALVVQNVQPVGIEIDPVLDVADKCVVCPAVPEARDDVEELARAAVARRVLDMLLKSEVQRRIRVGCRDEVPAGTAAADVIERGEFAGDV